jgi:hypothetical protein
MRSRRAKLSAILLVIAVFMWLTDPALALPAWSATSVTVVPGGSGASKVTATGLGGPEWSYACMGLPAGAVCSYASTGTTFNGHLDLASHSPITDTVTITTSTTTPTGRYTITLHIIACAGECQPDTSFTLTIRAPRMNPVGGIMLPSVGFSILVPWVLVLSLLGVVSVEVFIVKRRVKRR